MLDLLSFSSMRAPLAASLEPPVQTLSSDKLPPKAGAETPSCTRSQHVVCSACSDAEIVQDDFSQGAFPQSEFVHDALGQGTVLLDNVASETLVPETLVPAPFVLESGAEELFLPEEFSPETFVPEAFIPEAFVPESFSQDEFVHETLIQETLVQDTFSQDEFVHEAFPQDEFVQDVFSQDEFVHEAFSQVSLPVTDLLSASPQPPSFDLLPVGMMLNGRTVVFSVFVRGAEDGSQAVDFDRWLVPWDTLKETLTLSVTPSDSGQLKIRSPFLVAQLSADEIQVDPELGEVLSIQQLRDLLGDVVEFDIIEYAISFNLRPSTQQGSFSETSILLEGLEHSRAPVFAVSAIEQQSRFSSGGQAHLLGDVQAVGTAFGGSWYTEINQGNVGNPQSWSLGEAQYLREAPFADYAVGAHPPFWSTRNQDFWGFTTIQRQGFTPSSSSQAQGFSPQQRLQASQVERTVVGEAEPGTLVQLTQGNQNFVVDEILVDSSGTFRFDRIPIKFKNGLGPYQLQLFSDGRLATTPELRDVRFDILSGQLPVGATATSVALGLGHGQSTASAGRTDELSELLGGLGVRWGVSENTTIGVGGVYDDGWRGLGEVFFKPASLPLEFSAHFLSGTGGTDPEITARLNLQPSPGLDIDFRRDDLLEQVNVNWRLSPAWRAFGRYSLAGKYEMGAQWSWQKPNFSTYLQASINEKQNLRWSFQQRWGGFRLSHIGNESGLSSELSYSLSGRNGFSPSGHDVLIGHDQQNVMGNSLVTTSWRYRSASRDVSGNRDWAVTFGGGWGFQGSGVVASLETAILPGFLLKAQYRDISLTSNEAEYSIELASSFNTQRGLVAGDQQADQLRGEGGIMLQPFLDRNANGVHDPDESYYTEEAELLFIINNKPIQEAEASILKDRVLLQLPSGHYRLDLDPAGFPLNWKVETSALAVDVVAGSYTPVPIPFQPSYTVIGVVSSPDGEPLTGVRVEAVPENTVESIVSITNGAGVYVLEELQQGHYQLQVNDVRLEPSTLEITDTTVPFQELNLQTVLQ